MKRQIISISTDVISHNDGSKFACAQIHREADNPYDRVKNYVGISIASYLRVLRAQQKYFYLGPISGFNECDCKLPDEICRACEARFALTPLEGIF
jgi:hypothetical protein